jgi:hypothetical protein
MVVGAKAEGNDLLSLIELRTISPLEISYRKPPID